MCIRDRNTLLKEAQRRGFKVSRGDVERFLRSQVTYILHKQARWNFPSRKTIVSDIDMQWQADLVDMHVHSRYNRGVKYLLTVIYCFSRYAWVIPVKRKNSNDMLVAIKNLINRVAYPRKPKALQTDAGKEFFNRPVQDYLATQNIKLFATHSQKKAALVERFNRTLKRRMWLYFTVYGTRKLLRNC